MTTQQGFHNSFDHYCDWCDAQASAGLKTVSWGKWWELEKENKMDAMLNGEVCQSCGDEMESLLNNGEGVGYPVMCPACLEAEED